MKNGFLFLSIFSFVLWCFVSFLFGFVVFCKCFVVSFVVFCEFCSEFSDFEGGSLAVFLGKLDSDVVASEGEATILVLIGPRRVGGLEELDEGEALDGAEVG